jgi:hypothetical protein
VAAAADGGGASHVSDSLTAIVLTTICFQSLLCYLSNPLRFFHMASGSNPSTPPPLTPQSTGDHEASRSSSTTPYKKPQAAFYPHVNSTNKPEKPFSRSAAKRESVMALGSIEHLQHYFTKTGIAAKKECVSLRSP